MAAITASTDTTSTTEPDQVKTIKSTDEEDKGLAPTMDTSATSTNTTKTSKPAQVKEVTSGDEEDKGLASTSTGVSFISPTIVRYADPPCPRHTDQQQNIYCCTCSAAICAECQFTVHSGHDFMLSKTKKLQDELDRAVLNLLQLTSACSTQCGIMRGKLHQAEAGKKEELNQISQMKAIAEDSLLTQFKSAVALLQSHLEIRGQELCQAVKKQQLNVEEKWESIIQELKGAIQTANNAVQKSATELDEAKNTVKNPEKIQTAISSVEKTKTTIPDLERLSKLGLPSVSPQSDFAEYSDLTLSIVSYAKGLARARKMEEAKPKSLTVLEKPAPAKEAPTKDCTVESQKDLVNVLPKIPQGGSCDTIGYVAVKKTAFKSWEEASAKSDKKLASPMKWPEYELPLTWWSRCGNSVSVIFLPPAIGKNICEIVGGKIELTHKLLNKEFHCLQAVDGSVRYIGARLEDGRGKTGGCRYMGEWLLPANVSLKMALKSALGFTPSKVVGQKPLDLEQTCLQWRSSEKKGQCLRVED